ncbi:MAG: hypothetical protein WBM86_13555 [Waterburya sp.]
MEWTESLKQVLQETAKKLICLNSNKTAALCTVFNFEPSEAITLTFQVLYINAFKRSHYSKTAFYE